MQQTTAKIVNDIGVVADDHLSKTVARTNMNGRTAVGRASLQQLSPSFLKKKVAFQSFETSGNLKSEIET